MVPHTISPVMKEFRLMKLESIIKDLHKLSPDELKKVQQEINELLGFTLSGESDEQIS
ncbi:MAG: hypothetical protein H0Z33_00810 [Bacillaceae bacterium]|nr:hypothetical protein [Bacillaceae bacterium]